MELKEGVNLEYKREYSDDIRKTVIAFANTSGGTILVGMNDDGSVYGVKNPDDTMLQLSNSIRTSIMPDVTLFVEYKHKSIDGKDIIEIEVQKGTSSPYYLASKGIRPSGVYVRQGASSVPATETAILHMIKETDGSKYEDLRSTNQELTFESAKKEFADRDVAFGEAQQITLGIKNSDGIYTNLGLLISDQCKHTIKAAYYEGLEKEIFKDRREFTGSLLRQLNEAYTYIDQYNKTRAEVDGLHRIDMRDYPAELIREALLNSLVHREYSYSSSTLISIFEDRIEFVSVGGLVKRITIDDIMLGVSITRNEKLANIFYRLGLIEAYGTGIPKIIKGYASYPRKAEIKATDNAFKIILPNMNMEPESKSSSLLPGVDETQIEKIMGFLSETQFITRKDVEVLLGTSQATSTRILRNLIQDGYIKANGKGRNTKYEKA